jgi:hypothetical protein
MWRAPRRLAVAFKSTERLLLHPASIVKLNHASKFIGKADSPWESLTAFLMTVWRTAGAQEMRSAISGSTCLLP